jgi:putative endonuclease
MSFHVYIIVSEFDQSFYIGQTANLSDRLERHNGGLEKYTSKKRPWKLIWSSEVSSRSEAMKLERKIKNFKSRKRTQQFIEANHSGQN